LIEHVNISGGINSSWQTILDMYNIKKLIKKTILLCNPLTWRPKANFFKKNNRYNNYGLFSIRVPWCYFLLLSDYILLLLNWFSLMLNTAFKKDRALFDFLHLNRYIPINLIIFKIYILIYSKQLVKISLIKHNFIYKLNIKRNEVILYWKN